jgi:hypothetical protein
VAARVRQADQKVQFFNENNTNSNNNNRMLSDSVVENDEKSIFSNILLQRSGEISHLNRNNDSAA